MGKHNTNRLSLFLRIVAGLVFGVFLADFLAAILAGPGRNIGGVFGAFATLLIVLYCIFFKKINAFFAKHKILKGVTCTILTLGILYIGIATVFIVTSAHKKAPESSRPAVVVVLGCRVKDGRPSMMLAKRINTAYEYLSQHPDSYCICSGGQGADESMSEAKCIRDELVRKGIEPDRLYLEDKSTSTRENLRFSKKIMVDEDLGDTIVIVTDSFHELRAQLIASSLDLPAGGYGASTSAWLLPSYYVRELFGIAYQIVFAE